MRIICYVYDADHHCESCMLKRFGPNAKTLIWNGVLRDGEDNEVTPLYDIETSDYIAQNGSLACGDCLEILEEPAFDYYSLPLEDDV